MKLFLLWSIKLIAYPLIVTLLVLTISLIVTHFVTKASNDRDWNDDQKILPYAEISGNQVSIHNIRNFTYTSPTTFIPNYYDKVFDLNKIKKVWYIVEPFSGIPGSAHTFLSFEFEDNTFVSISIEIRKEKGESFNPLKGLFNQYELMYVIADERDVVKLRSNYRNDLVYVYPIKASIEKVRHLFLDMVERANQLKDYPEFYNSITNTCTTNIVEHVNTITPKRVPLLNLKILLPANSDHLAYEADLIDTDLPFNEARKKYYINDRAKKYADSPDFSVKIREIE